MRDKADINLFSRKTRSHKSHIHVGERGYNIGRLSLLSQESHLRCKTRCGSRVNVEDLGFFVIIGSLKASKGGGLPPNALTLAPTTFPSGQKIICSR